jgi:hypothetical protein
MSNNTGGKTTAAPRTIHAAQITAFRRPLQVGEVPVIAPRADGAVARVEHATDEQYLAGGEPTRP